MKQPGLPLKAKRAPSDNAEFKLQAALVQHLRIRAYPGTYWTAMPNGEKRSAVTGSRLKAMGLRAGNPDILFIRAGRCFGLELKALRIGKRGAPLAGGGQSDAQVLAEREWKAAGGAYAVAVGMDDALLTLEAWGIIRPDRAAAPVYRPKLREEHV